MNWKDCPQSLIEIELKSNKITNIVWKGCSQNLVEIVLRDNQITHICWENCPQSLKSIDIYRNKIKEMIWKGCPRGLIKITLKGNQITELNWKYVPWDLKLQNEDLANKYNEYKKSRDNIPDLPYQCSTQRHKEFMKALTHTFLLPPKISGFKSPYYEFKLYENGGISYRDAMKEMTS